MVYQTYRGIDFAIERKRRAELRLIDDGNSLEVSDSCTDVEVMTAIDCPLGTTAGFVDLLAGRIPVHMNDGFQSRRTEDWARGYVERYETVTSWKLQAGGRKGPTYFHRTSHIQPATAMRIIPACLDYVLDQLSLQSGSQTERRGALIAARRGEARFVEAHPRLFLYSALERIHRASRAALSLDTLAAAARYKSSKAELRQRAMSNRRRLYGVLREDPAWMGGQRRQLEPADPPDWLISTDHCFDAWLCALTAWAHDHSECLDWHAAGLPEDLVEIEGHLLILST